MFVCVCVVDLALRRLPSLPQAGGQSLGLDHIALYSSKELIQPVGPLAHGSDVKPQSICRTKNNLTTELLRVSGLVQVSCTWLFWGAADSEWVPLIFGNCWDVDVNIISWFEMEKLGTFDHQVSHLHKENS